MPVPCELRSTGPQDRCKSARGPDADLRRNILIYFISEGSRFGADSHTGTLSRISTSPRLVSVLRSLSLTGDSFKRFPLISRSVHRRAIARSRSKSAKGVGARLSVMAIDTHKERG